jgi:hypothetical protein
MYVQLGTNYQSTSYCSVPSTAAEGIAIAYSTNGGITFTLMTTIAYSSYRTPTEVTFALPAAAKSSTTRFMVWQPSSSGSSYDVWV